MSGITNPAEEYFKDGTWGYDAIAGVWKKLLVDVDGRLIVAAEDKVYSHFRTDAGQNIANNTHTIIDFEDEVYDPDGLVTTGAAWKFTPTVAGYYHVSAYIMYDTTGTWADGEVASLSVYKNGASFEPLDRKDNYNTNSPYMVLHGSTYVYLNGSTDYIDIRTFQKSGGALTFIADGPSNHVAIHRI